MLSMPLRFVRFVVRFTVCVISLRHVNMLWRTYAESAEDTAMFIAQLDVLEDANELPEHLIDVSVSHLKEVRINEVKAQRNVVRASTTLHYMNVDALLKCTPNRWRERLSQTFLLTKP